MHACRLFRKIYACMYEMSSSLKDIYCNKNLSSITIWQYRNYMYSTNNRINEILKSIA